MSVYQTITYDYADRVATIALDRPDHRNGYTLQMADELGDAFRRANGDEKVRVVVFTGKGDDFCVGADLSGGSFDTGAGQDASWKEPVGRCSLEIFNLDKPVIAAVRGNAIGGGSTMILPADFRLASNDARFGFVFSRRGIYPEGASTWFLPRLVGMGTALDWMVSGRLIDAQEALTAGLVTRLYPPDELLDAAYELASVLVDKTAPVSIAVIRQMLYRLSALESPLDVQRVDSRLIAGIADNPDAIEGVTSFMQRRAPRWTLTVDNDIPDWLPWRQP